MSEEQQKEKEEKPSIPNNLDHMVISGLMDGSFNGPFDIDFDGNHSIIIGPSGQVTIYRATRTAPVAFIARGSNVVIHSKTNDGDLTIEASGDGCELKAIVKKLSGIVVVPVDDSWLSLEKAILEATYSLEGKFGAKRISLIVWGANIADAITGDIKDLKLFGRMRRFSATQVEKKLVQMIGEGLLERVPKKKTIFITNVGLEKMHKLREELGVVDLAFDGKGDNPC